MVSFVHTDVGTSLQRNAVSKCLDATGVHVHLGKNLTLCLKRAFSAGFHMQLKWFLIQMFILNCKQATLKAKVVTAFIVSLKRKMHM